MSKSYENKMMVNGSSVSGLIEVEQFAAQRTQANTHDSNQTIRESSSSHSDAFRQQDRTMKLPPTGDSNVQGAHKVGVVERLPAINSNSCDSAAFQPKNISKSKRGEAVKSVTEWIIPSGTENKHSFVVSCWRRGVDPKVAFRHEDKSPKDPGTVRVNRKRRRYNKTDTDNEMIHPVVAGVKFDKRFLKYGVSQCGEKRNEILVRVLPLPSPNCTQAKEAWENDFMEQIPDEPSRTKTSSRVGPRYQARIPSKPTCTNVPDELFPGYDMLWDQKLATEAEQRGEDISGFLNGNHDFGKHELLHSTLHKNGYNVSLARIELEQMQRQGNAGSSSTFNEDEAKRFESLMRSYHKDISRVAKTLKRKRSECLVHYYNWKASSRRYQGLKEQWNDQYCSVCQDGGLLIICDGCSLNFHMECVEPPLTAVPECNWLCGSCKHTKQTGPSIYTGTHHSRKRPLTYYESSSDTENFSEQLDGEEM